MGYNFGKYMQHWINLAKPHKVRYVFNSGDAISKTVITISGASDLSRELVPCGQEQEIPVAGLLRQHSRFGLDLPPFGWTGQCSQNCNWFHTKRRYEEDRLRVFLP